MDPIIIKQTLGGLDRQYHFRQQFFGALIGLCALYFLAVSPYPVHLSSYLSAIVNSLLYPYSRFAYESAVNFFVGKNIFFGNAILILGVKLITMMICWSMAIFIAPIGLVYLYYHHNKST